MIITKENVGTYKWVKIAQAAILIILGAMFIVTSLVNQNSDGDVSLMLSISIGTVVVIYGVLDVVSGYLLYRNPYNREVLIGGVFLSLGVVLFVQRDILNQIFSYYVAILFIVMAAIIVVHGLINVLGKNKKTKTGVLAFVVAGLMLAVGVTYLILYLNNINKIQIYMLLILGVILVIAGVTLFISLLIKAKNTDAYFEEKDKEKELDGVDAPAPNETKTKKFRFFKKIENKSKEEPNTNDQIIDASAEESKIEK